MDGGNTFQQARFLGTAVLRKGTAPMIQAADSMQAGETVEWYRFRIKGRSSSPALKPMLGFTGTEVVNRMEVFQAVNGKPKKLMARLNNINGLRQRPLPEGTFFIKVSATPSIAAGQFSTFVAQISLFG